MSIKNMVDKSFDFIEDYVLEDSNLVKLNTEILPECKYYPESKDIFNVFKMPLKDIKVVILGQDPYPNPRQALGYSFAVNTDVYVPTSLAIIRNTILRSEAPNQIHEIKKDWRTLKHWNKQGIFLLNTALTVEDGKAGSHLKYWKDFTNKVINKISEENEEVIWVLWGRKAQSFKEQINPRSKNILEGPHPAAEAYSGGKAGFYTCNHFNMINSILKKQNKETINW